jgi:hypothetical protein
MPTAQTDLSVAIQKTISLFNRLRSPEVNVKAVVILPETVTIAFSGSFCYECGSVAVYIEEFISNFKVFNTNLILKAGKTRQISPRSFETTFYVHDNKLPIQ